MILVKLKSPYSSRPIPDLFRIRSCLARSESSSSTPSTILLGVVGYGVQWLFISLRICPSKTGIEVGKRIQLCFIR
uniref:Uncharacterized protein n=1 Tax=Kalanchoe fedtschenkoi TaxID=63787 RepID=A0A7N0UKW5_KALFE